MGKQPRLSRSSLAPTVIVTALDEHGRARETAIPGERDLTVYVNKRELVTLMTLGGAPELLVLGYLRNQRLVEALDEVESIQVDWETGAAAVRTRAPIDRIEERTSRRVVTTGCGQGTVFGGLMDELGEVRLDPSFRIAQRTLYSIAETIRSQDSVYRQAGSVHGCGLFAATADGSRLLMFFEDVGRHNAVDAIAGRMWLEDVSGRDKIFYTTGRLTSEMVIKGAQMGIPVLMSRSGVTQMGFAVANQVGMTLFGRCTGRHFLLFTGKERFVAESEERPSAAGPVALQPSVPDELSAG